MQAQSIILQCCVCERVKSGEGWVHVAIASDAPGSVSHGYCPVCFEMAMASITVCRPDVSLQAAYTNSREGAVSFSESDSCMRYLREMCEICL